jgi:hypothetical protein
VTAPRNVNRCTPCLNNDHNRCTGSAGNIGCGCIHAAPAPISLDPARVRQALDDLEQERREQQAIVTWLDDALDGAERTLTSIDRRLADLRAEPAVQTALERGSSRTLTPEAVQNLTPRGTST